MRAKTSSLEPDAAFPKNKLCANTDMETMPGHIVEKRKKLQKNA